jgi:hypothetical protein
MLRPGKQKCIRDLYDQARRDKNGINCSKDLTASCLCSGSSINFWYGIRDCSQFGCARGVYDQVAKWKDEVLCDASNAESQSVASSPPAKQHSMPIPSYSPTAKPNAGLDLLPNVISYKEDGTIKYRTMPTAPTERATVEE